jgi:hypothetical protein
MKSILLILILTLGHLTAIGQQTFTIRVLDSKSGGPVKEAKIYSKNQTFNSNHLGFFQIEANISDTILLEHDDYQTSSLNLPKETSFQVKTDKEGGGIEMCMECY